MAPRAEPQDFHTTGTRLYSDGRTKDFKQGLVSRLVAVVTLTLYTGWLHIMFGLCVAAFFSRAALVVLLLLLATLKLPAKPVLWPAFNRLWIFKTWREYFNYRCGPPPRPRQLGAGPGRRTYVCQTPRTAASRPPARDARHPPHHPPHPILLVLLYPCPLPAHHHASFSFEEILDKNKRYIFTEFPHGVYPLSPLIAGTLMQSMFDGFNIYRWGEAACRASWPGCCAPAPPGRRLHQAARHSPTPFPAAARHRPHLFLRSLRRHAPPPAAPAWLTSANAPCPHPPPHPLPLAASPPPPSSPSPSGATSSPGLARCLRPPRTSSASWRRALWPSSWEVGGVGVGVWGGRGGKSKRPRPATHAPARLGRCTPGLRPL
jgi:hypothetical protein